MKILFILFFIYFNLAAQVTICYKENLADIGNIKNIKLDGGECKGIYSVNEMKSSGWKLNDSFTNNNDNKYTLTYSFSKDVDTHNSPTKKKVAKPINLQATKTILSNVSKKFATIDIGNLSLGQSGVVLHQFKDNHTMILSYGIVIESNDLNSKIEFINEDILKQNAIPTTNLKPVNGDTFILNHLYDIALLITPNFEINNKIQKAFYKMTFISEDVFAGYLKLQENPIPTLDTFQEFAKINNIGLILIVVNDKLHVVDILSQKTIYSLDVSYTDTKTSLPFFTNVEGITTGTFDFFKDDSIEDYHKYYTRLLGL